MTNDIFPEYQTDGADYSDICMLQWPAYYLPSKVFFFRGEFGPPSRTPLLGSSRVCSPNGISLGSPGCALHIHKQRDRHTQLIILRSTVYRVATAASGCTTVGKVSVSTVHTSTYTCRPTLNSNKNVQLFIFLNKTVKYRPI